MEQTSLYLLVSSLRLSPDRFQFFKYESVFLSCEDRQSHSAVWRVKRRDRTNITSECHGRWGKMNTTGCAVSSMYPFDSGLYWCESSEGKSNTVNITVTDGDVILESPVLPVMEGSNVTLRCRTQKTSSDLPAEFFKYGTLIGTGSTGQITIHHVCKSDEGFYKCHISDRGESPESWMGVRDSGSVDQSFPPLDEQSPHVVGLIVGLLVVILLTILLVLLCRYRTSKDQCCVRPIQSQGTNDGSARTNQSGAADDVYCPLQHGNTSIYGVMRRSHDIENGTV